MSPRPRDETVEVRQRTLLNVDRRTGQSPLSISSLGDQRTLWASTGLILDGATKRIYLTPTGTATGGSVFKRRPSVEVLISLKTLTKADAPSDAGAPESLQPVGTWTLEWVSGATTFAVDITNESGDSADYLVRAEGF